MGYRGKRSATLERRSSYYRRLQLLVPRAARKKRAAGPPLIGRGCYKFRHPVERRPRKTPKKRNVSLRPADAQTPIWGAFGGNLERAA